MSRSLSRIKVALLLPLALLMVPHADAQKPATSPTPCASPFDPGNALRCYGYLQGPAGIKYHKTDGPTPLLFNVVKTVYRLDYTQQWPSLSDSYNKTILADPSQGKWWHTVTMYMPQKINTAKNAVVYLDGGTNIPKQGSESRAADENEPDWFTRSLKAWALQKYPEQANKLANKDAGMDLAFSLLADSTSSPVIYVEDIPNQYLTLVNQPPLRENDLMAQTWRMFMDDPLGGGTDQNSSMPRNQALPLNIPMGQSVSALTRFVQQEYGAQIQGLIMSGASKRGLAAWMGTLTETAVPIRALVPMAYDLLNSKEVLRHIRKAYGGQWPIAMQAFVERGVFADLESDNSNSRFSHLVTSADPMAYMKDPAYAGKFNIPILVANASSDGFFTPDNPAYYMADLEKYGGNKALYTLPNAGHGENIDVSQLAPILIAIINRVNANMALPTVNTGTAVPQFAKVWRLVVQYTQASDLKSATLYTATNPRGDRDFRLDCGIKYEKTDLPLPTTPGTILQDIPKQDGRYTAAFIELEYQDGLTVSSTTKVYPSTYPTKAPWSDGQLCQTIPDTGPGGK